MNDPSSETSEKRENNILVEGVKPTDGAVYSYLHNSSPFIAKLYSLVSSKEYEQYIGWSNEHNGTAFVIKQPELFSSNVLCKVFKQSSINSFIRQLNIYGFHTVCIIQRQWKEKTND